MKTVMMTMMIVLMMTMMVMMVPMMMAVGRRVLDVDVADDAAWHGGLLIFKRGRPLRQEQIGALLILGMRGWIPLDRCSFQPWEADTNTKRV